jgi:hypothetical protein
MVRQIDGTTTLQDAVVGARWQAKGTFSTGIA